MKQLSSTKILRLLFIQLLCLVLYKVPLAQIITKTTGVTNNTSKDGSATVKVVGPILSQTYEYAVDDDNFQSGSNFQNLDTGWHVAKARALATDGTCPCLSCVMRDSFTIKPKAVLTLPLLSINEVWQNEGNSGTTSIFTFNVKLSSPAGPGGVTFDIATGNGSAMAGSDYIASSFLAQTIQPGDSIYTFDVTVIGDNEVDNGSPYEYFFVNITNVMGAFSGNSSSAAIINDDDVVVPRYFTIDDVWQNEGDSGTNSTFTFTARLSSPAGLGGVTFVIRTAYWVATPDIDYITQFIRGTIPAGSSTYTFDVTVIGDNVPEPHEVFAVFIQEVRGAIAGGNFFGMIVNDDVLDKFDQTINFVPIADKTEGDEDFTVGAIASSGLPVSYSISSNPADIATLDKDTIAILAAGTVTITATQDGSIDYNAATPVSHTFTILPPSEMPLFYRDKDSDQYGNATDTIHAVTAPQGYVSNSWDCNDDNANIHPGGPEIANGIDDNCNCQIDEGLSTNANLRLLFISGYRLTPLFNPAVTSYTAETPNNVSSVIISLVTADPTATIKVNGSTLTNTNSVAVTLTPGPNTFTIIVTAQNATTTKTYTLIVVREISNNANLSNLAVSHGVLRPGFADGILNYTDTVINSVSSLLITPTPTDPNASVRVNSIQILNGTGSSVPLTVGQNVISIVVTAQDGTTTKAYTLTVMRAAAGSNNAYLSNLKISQGTLTPVFTQATTNYTASVANSVSSVTVTPTVANSAATVKVNNISVSSGSASGPITLNVGTNTITVVATAQDRVTTKLYTIVVTRAASNNANLASLKLSQGTLSPVFAPGTTSYKASVANSVAFITVTPTVADENATVKINGGPVISSLPSDPIPLAVGPNTITIVVTAQDGTTKTYTLTVTRAASNNANLSSLVISQGTLTPIFAPATINYTASVAYLINSITVTPTVANATAKVKVNGIVVPSGSTSGAIALNVGATTITMVVTAQDGTTTKTYKVVVTRAQASTNANLSNLIISQGILTPVFSPGTTSYTASVSSSVTTVTITATVADVNATVKINSISVLSGNPSDPIPLAVGSNTITIVVTAQNGTNKTYKVVVTRAASTNASLLNLQLSQGNLVPVFAPATINYTASVAYLVGSITVTPTVADATAAVKVNGISVTSGSASGAIVLGVGANTITIAVTAQDGTTTRTYRVVVTRQIQVNINPVVTVSPGIIYYAGAPQLIDNNITVTDADHTNLVSATVMIADGFTPGVDVLQFTPQNGINGSYANGQLTLTGVSSVANYQAALRSVQYYNNIPHPYGWRGITFSVNDGTSNSNTGYRILEFVEYDYFPMLSNLTISQGTLTPAFAQQTTSYTASVANNVPSITVTPTVGNTIFTIKVNNTIVPSGSASGVITLNVGVNTVTIVVTAPDGTNKIYTVNVTRAAASISEARISVQVDKTGQPAIQYPSVAPGKDPRVITAKELNIYPNPTNGEFAVQVYNLKDAKASIQILNGNGKIVEQKSVSLSKTASVLVKFNIRNQPAGMYYVKVIGADGVQTAKVILQAP